MHINEFPTLKEELLGLMTYAGYDEPNQLDVFKLINKHSELADMFIEDCEDTDRAELCFPKDIDISCMDATRSLEAVIAGIKTDITNHIICHINDTLLEQMQGSLDQYYKSQGEPSRIYGD